MSDELFIFQSDQGSDLLVNEPKSTSMTDSQRRLIRDAFGQLGLSTAKQQFAAVEELTGVHIGSVQDLRQSTAQTLTYRLGTRVKNAVKPNTGNSWADRDEDTWIDNL